LTDGVVAEIEADSDLAAEVRQRTVQRQFVDEEHIAWLHRKRSSTVAGSDQLRDLETPWSGRTVVEETMSMRPGYDLETSVFDTGVAEREPDSEHLGVICLREDHTVVLVPVRRSHLELPGCRVTRFTGFGCLDAHVLHWVGVDLVTDEAFDEVEQVRASQEGEHRRTMPHRRVVTNVGLGQREVKVLGVRLVGLDADLDKPLTERKFPMRTSDPSGGKQFVCETVEDNLVFLENRPDPTFGIKGVADQQIAIAVKLFPLFGGELRHGDFTSHSRLAIRAAASNAAV
jgi:hypothetical protein